MLVDSIQDSTLCHLITNQELGFLREDVIVRAREVSRTDRD